MRHLHSISNFQTSVYNSKLLCHDSPYLDVFLVTDATSPKKWAAPHVLLAASQLRGIHSHEEGLDTSLASLSEATEQGGSIT